MVTSRASTMISSRSSSRQRRRSTNLSQERPLSRASTFGSDTDSLPPISRNMTGLGIARRDTGFPEALSERTTNLPYPGAIISPDAIIGQEDLAENPLYGKSTRRWSKYRRTLSHGKIDPRASATSMSTGSITPAMFTRRSSGLSLGGLSMSEAGDAAPVTQAAPVALSPTLSSSRGSTRRSSMSSHRDDLSTPPSSPDMAEHPAPKKRFFRRLRRGSHKA